jgi:hypothetical protein
VEQYLLRHPWAIIAVVFILSIAYALFEHADLSRRIKLASDKRSKRISIIKLCLVWVIPVVSLIAAFESQRSSEMTDDHVKDLTNGVTIVSNQLVKTTRRLDLASNALSEAKISANNALAAQKSAEFAAQRAIQMAVPRHLTTEQIKTIRDCLSVIPGQHYFIGFNSADFEAVTGRVFLGHPSVSPRA